MMVYGEAFESDPDYQSGQTEFWCTLTMKSYGPDGAEVALEPCRDRGRSCYREY
jgi:hypothetical protein